MIVYGTDAPGSPLMQISAAGGEPTPLFTPDDQRGSWYPQVLPDSDAVLFTLSNPAPDAGELHLVMLDTGEHRTLVPNAAAGRVLDTGHLVFVRSGALWAVPFDRKRLDVAGNPVPIVEGVLVSSTGAVQYALADDGSLVYVPGTSGSGGVRLVWVDSSGTEEPLATPARDYSTLSLSPDGARAALGITDQSGNADVWVSELARGTLTRITTDEAFDGNPVWHPDGQRVAFASDRNGAWEVLLKSSDGSGTAERVVMMDEAVTDVVPYDWSPDGVTLFAQAVLPETRGDVGMVSSEGPDTWELLIASAEVEGGPTLSPNGRWLAYSSSETGSPEVYVQRFPELEGRRPVSVGGGYDPTWSADGRELIYVLAPTGPPEAVMRVTLEVDGGDPPSFIMGAPERLFDWRYRSGLGGYRHYDLSPDGRFLMIVDSADVEGRRVEIKVVLNWHQELLERVPIP